MTTPALAGVAVPAYAHPVLAPASWRLLRTADLGAGFVVLNVASGPGEQPDQAYADELQALLGLQVPIRAYLDTSYCARSGEAVVAEAALYRQWYGVTGVFLDQVAPDAASLDHYRAIVTRLRSDGATSVVLNPGVVPDPGISALADVVVTFEGSWKHYRRLSPARAPGEPAVPVCHLVYGVPPWASTSQLARRAAAAGAGILGISSGGLPNPWTMTGRWLPRAGSDPDERADLDGSPW